MPHHSLTQANLSALPPEIKRPLYDRTCLKTPIVHIGVGGFHRSHEAAYSDALMNQTGSSDYGICGIGLREEDRKIADILKAQDGLYTLIEKAPDNRISNRVIGSIADFLLGPDNPSAVIQKIAHSDTQIVSLTITEGGYNQHPSTGEFDFSQPTIQHDLAHPESPTTVFGYLAAGLRARREAGRPSLTILSCDNIQHNGDVTKRMLCAYVERLDPELASWIETEVTFPNAMVDRITPVTTSEDIKWLKDSVGIADQWPVTCEPFCQWVIEDHFAHGRPPWEDVGAQFVADVSPYEKMKLQLLNAGHSFLGILGSLLGHQTIDDCIGDTELCAALRRFMDDEATPSLDPVPGIDLEAYKDTLFERFANPNIRDSLVRICLESSSKIPSFILPTLGHQLKTGGSIEGATLVLAAWCFYSRHHTDQKGNPLEVIDAMKDALEAAALNTSKDPLSFLRFEPLFGRLIDNQPLTRLYERFTSALEHDRDVRTLFRNST